MSRRTRSIFTAESLTADASWSRLWLSRAESVRDPSALLGITEETDTESAFTLAGGIGANTANTAAVWLFPLCDRTGRALDPAKPWSPRFLIEVETAPGAASDLWVTAGLTDDSTFGGLWRHGGLLYDAAGGPHCRAGTEAATTDASQNAATAGAAVTFEIAATAIQQVRAWGLTSAGAYVTSTQRTGVAYLTGAIYGFIAAGRSTAVAGDATIGLRAYVLDMLQGPGFTS